MKKLIDNKAQPDHLYYNIRIANTKNTSIPASYNETRTQPILNSCLKDYEVAVARFKIPNNIPIFIFQNNTYSVTLTGTDGIDHTTFCQWIPTAASGDQNVWQYAEWAQSVTNALNTSYVAIDAKVRPSVPPFVLFDPEQLTFSIYATNEYNSVANDGTKTQIWMNNPCFGKFEAWNAYYNTTVSAAKYANVLIQSLGTNLIVAGPTTVLNTSPAVPTTSYYKMEQEFKCLFLLSDFDSLLLKCSSLPIFSEQFSSQTTSDELFQIIMTDFEPAQDIDFNNRSLFQYNPAVYRWASMSSNANLRDMDLSLFWKDIFGITRPITINYNQICTVKLAFRKKSTLIHKE